jgi:folate-dependent phosphoribosylglycinamide formyltransferase PurN
MTTKNIVILTGNERRHQFARKALALIPGLNVLESMCEGKERSVRNLIVSRAGPGQAQELGFLDERELAENDAFSHFCALAPDFSNPTFISKGDVNSPDLVSYIANSLKPDLLVAYGCSIIHGPLLSLFQRRFLNLHLGLSPYYRGAGTNYWPLVNSEPEFVGATFMHLDAGIDTGEIIHQIRGRIYPNDSPHQLGNRLIVDAVLTYGAVIRVLGSLKQMPQPKSTERKYYRKHDYTSKSVQTIREVFREGMIHDYLDDRSKRDKKVRIVTNQVVVDELHNLKFPSMGLTDI